MPVNSLCHRNQPCILLTFILSLFCMVCHQMGMVEASNNPAAPSTYVSVRALDRFGHSVQLKHAREAAHRHGRLVVAASINGTVLVISAGNKPIVHSMSLPLPTSANSNHVALCCTGVKGDINWLISEVRQYVAQVWERYNNEPDSVAMAHAVARLLGSFNGEDLDQEWQSSIPRESHSWARPLGVQTLILSTRQPNLLLVEPSGRVLTMIEKENWSVGTVGKGSSALQEKLERLSLDDEQTTSAIALEEAILKTIFDLDSGNTNFNEFMVESLSSKGVERELLRYKNRQLVSRTPHEVRG